MTWPTFKVAELVEKVGSGSTPRGGSSTYHETGVPFIRSMNVHFHGFVENGLVFLSDEQAYALRGATVRADDVLLNITGASIGRVTTAPSAFEGARVNQHVCIIRPGCALDSRYFAAFLASPGMQRLIWDEQAGMTRQALTKGQILDIDVPLPPLNEQRRIGAKIDALQARSRRAREALDAVPALLDRFRQSVLAAAFRGDLTADWRAKYPDVEPASALLERIRAERKVRWIAAQAEKARARAEAKARKAGKHWGPADDRRVLAAAEKKAEGKYTEPGPVDPEAEGLPELPEGWCWASLEEVSWFQRNGVSAKPKARDGLRILRISSVRTLHLNADDVRYLPAHSREEYGDYLLAKGDLLFTRYNGNADLVGVCAVVQGDINAVGCGSSPATAAARLILDRAAA